MRLVKALGLFVAATVAVVGLSASSNAAGDEELVKVTCKNGELSAEGKAPWHTNKEAPWKWDKGSKVSIDEHAAKFKGDKCEGTLKAFICNGDQCKGPIKVAVK